MAFHILISKISESEEKAIYSFYDSACPSDIGELELNKVSGTTKQLNGTNEQLYTRASTKVKKSFKSGELPKTLEWAS